MTLFFSSEVWKDSKRSAIVIHRPEIPLSDVDLSQVKPVAFVDMIQIRLSGEPSKPLMEKLLQECPQSYRPREAPNHVVAPFPSDEALRILDRMTEQSCPLSRLEIALDYCVPGKPEAIRLRSLIEPLLVQVKRRRRKSPEREYPYRFKGDEGTTLYFDVQASPVNLAVYSDLLSKKTGESCLHLCWRLNGTGSIRHAGIERPADLIAFDCDAFWRQWHRLELIVDAASIGRAFLKGNPAYEHKRPPCSDSRIGQIIARSAIGIDEEQTELTAQRLREFARECSWFDAGKCVRRVVDRRLLPHNPEIPRERRLKPKRRGRPGQRKNIAKTKALNPHLSDRLWNVMKRFVPAYECTHRFGGGRPRTNDRLCMTAIVAWASGRGSWKQLSKLTGCPDSTAHNRMKEWIAKGVFVRMKEAGLDAEVGLRDVNWSRLQKQKAWGYSDEKWQPYLYVITR